MRRVGPAVLVLLFFVANVMVCPGERAYACSCVESSVKEKLETYSAVFTGKVVEIGGDSIFSSREYKKYTLDVDTTWKGVDAKKTTILINNMGEGACGITLAKDQSYLIFANQDDKDGKLYSSLCSGNLQIEQAGEAINMLGKGTPVSSDDFTDSSSGYSNPWMISLYAGGAVVILALVGGSLWRKKQRRA
ncbi:hypothetical protein [Paenibacillus sp. FSL K6-1558]|uniref:hypothetical protein n=1 Tax=Paenibacillus sp. FSL K6-1558 TaxID=2921473 RepID=UPI0012B92850|nr:hypothetical protein [Paenibacillus xylanexedens]